MSGFSHTFWSTLISKSPLLSSDICSHFLSLIVLLCYGIESSDVRENLGEGLTGLDTQLGYFVALILVSNIGVIAHFTDTLLPYNTGIVEGTKDVQEFVGRLVHKLHRPAAAVPAEGRYVIEQVVDAALVCEHVQKHVAHVHLRPRIFVEVAEWVIGERVNVLVKSVNVIGSKALWIDEKPIIVVEATLHASHEPVHLIEPKARLSHVN